MKIYISTSTFLSMLKKVEYYGVITTLLCKFEKNCIVFQETKTHVVNYRVPIVDADATFNGCIEVQLNMFLSMLDTDMPTLIEFTDNEWFISGKCSNSTYILKYSICNGCEDKSIKYLQLSGIDSHTQQYYNSILTDAHSTARSVCKQLEKTMLKDPAITFSGGSLFIVSSNIIYKQKCEFANFVKLSIPYSTFNELCNFLSSSGSNTFSYNVSTDFIDVQSGFDEIRIPINTAFEVSTKYSDDNIGRYNIKTIKQAVKMFSKILPNSECTLYAIGSQLQVSISRGTLSYSPVDDNFVFAIRLSYIQLSLLCSIYDKIDVITMSVKGNTVYFTDGVFDYWISALVTNGGVIDVT